MKTTFNQKVMMLILSLFLTASIGSQVYAFSLLNSVTDILEEVVGTDEVLPTTIIETIVDPISDTIDTVEDTVNEVTGESGLGLIELEIDLLKNDVDDSNLLDVGIDVLPSGSNEKEEQNGAVNVGIQIGDILDTDVSVLPKQDEDRTGLIEADIDILSPGNSKEDNNSVGLIDLNVGDLLDTTIEILPNDLSSGSDLINVDLNVLPSDSGVNVDVCLDPLASLNLGLLSNVNECEEGSSEDNPGGVNVDVCLDPLVSLNLGLLGNVNECEEDSGEDNPGGVNVDVCLDPLVSLNLGLLSNVNECEEGSGDDSEDDNPGGENPDNGDKDPEGEEPDNGDKDPEGESPDNEDKDSDDAEPDNGNNNPGNGGGQSGGENSGNGNGNVPSSGVTPIVSNDHQSSSIVSLVDKSSDGNSEPLATNTSLEHFTLLNSVPDNELEMSTTKDTSDQVTEGKMTVEKNEIATFPKTGFFLNSSILGVLALILIVIGLLFRSKRMNMVS